jgi:hypothetical protein
MMHMHRLEWTFADKIQKWNCLFSHKVPKLFPLVAHFDSPNLICYITRNKIKRIHVLTLVASNSFYLHFLCCNNNKQKTNDADIIYCMKKISIPIWKNSYHLPATKQASKPASTWSHASSRLGIFNAIISIEYPARHDQTIIAQKFTQLSSSLLTNSSGM